MSIRDKIRVTSWAGRQKREEANICLRMAGKMGRNGKRSIVL